MCVMGALAPFWCLAFQKVHCYVRFHVEFHVAPRRNQKFLHECTKYAPRHLVDSRMIGITEVAFKTTGGGGEATWVTGRMGN